MKKDFWKVLASVVFGAVLICILFISPFVVPEDFDFSSSFALMTYLLMLFLFFIVALAIFNNDISKRFCRGKEIVMKNEIKVYVFAYLLMSIIISIGFLFYTFLNGGPENLYQIANARTKIYQVVAEEKPYIATCWKIIAGAVFFGFQYFNAKGFCDIIFEKFKKKLFKDNKLCRW